MLGIFYHSVPTSFQITNSICRCITHIIKIHDVYELFIHIYQELCLSGLWYPLLQCVKNEGIYMKLVMRLNKKCIKIPKMIILQTSYPES